jgi:hypothetical protein
MCTVCAKYSWDQNIARAKFCDGRGLFSMTGQVYFRRPAEFCDGRVYFQWHTEFCDGRVHFRWPAEFCDGRVYFRWQTEFCDGRVHFRWDRPNFVMVEFILNYSPKFVMVEFIFNDRPNLVMVRFICDDRPNFVPEPWSTINNHSAFIYKIQKKILDCIYIYKHELDWVGKHDRPSTIDWLPRMIDDPSSFCFRI